MKIRSVKLKNIGCHADFYAEFRNGVNVLLGANGSGKSTVMRAVYAAITNDFTRMRTKALTISSFEYQEVDKSFIELLFDHNGSEVKIRRNLKPSSCKLSVRNEGKKDFTVLTTKSHEIKDYMLEQFGLTSDMLEQFVFVDQWKLSSFLHQTKKYRADAFRRICGLDWLLPVEKAVGTFVSNNAGNAQPADITFLEAALEEAKAVEEKQAATVESHKEYGEPVTARWLQDMETKIAKAERASSASKLLVGSRKSLELVKEKRAETRKQFDEIKAAREELSKQWASQREEYEGLVRKRDKLIAAASDYQDYLSGLTQLGQREERYATVSKQHTANKLALDTFTEEYGKLQHLTRQHDIARSRLAELKESLSTLDTASSSCPTCRQDLSEDAFATLEKLADELRAEVQKLQPLCSEGTSLQEDWNTSAANLETCSSRIEASEGRVEETLQKVKAAGVDIETATVESMEEALATVRAQIDKYEAFRSSVTIATQKGKRLKEKFQEQTQEQVDGQDTVERLTKQAEGALSDEELQKKKDTLGEKRAHADLCARAVATWEAATSVLVSAQNRLAAAKERQESIAISTQYMDTVKEVLSMVKWDRLPFEVTRNNLSFLEDSINATLGVMESGFRIVVDDDIQFQVFFQDGRRTNHYMLSGGQSVLLSLAVRFSLEKLYGKHVGFLFMDEPCAGLDDENQIIVADAVVQSTDTRDSQVVVVTHNEAFAVRADHVIRT